MIIPFIITAIIITVIRSIQPLIHRKLINSSADHPNLAGLTLAGIHVQIFVLIMDLLACIYSTTNNHEYSGNNVMRTFNLYIVFFTIAFDAVVTLVISVLFMYYLCCSTERRCHKFRMKSSCLIKCQFCLIFGKKLQANVSKTALILKLRTILKIRQLRMSAMCGWLLV